MTDFHSWILAIGIAVLLWAFWWILCPYERTIQALVRVYTLVLVMVFALWTEIAWIGSLSTNGLILRILLVLATAIVILWVSPSIRPPRRKSNPRDLTKKSSSQLWIIPVAARLLWGSDLLF